MRGRRPPRGTGATPAVAQGLTLLRKLGRYVEYSVFGSEVTVDWSIISDGKVPIGAVCTHQFALADFEKAFELVEDSSGDSVKVSPFP